MLKWVGGLMDRLCAAAGAVLFAQAPLFMQQYTQQLIGRQAELKWQVDLMQRAAAASGKTLDAYINKFTMSGDSDFIMQGETMQALVQRWHQLTDALAGMQDSTLWSRPFTFLYHLNGDVFSSTLVNFNPGLPINLEGGVYALAGLLTGYYVFAALRGLFRWTTRFVVHV